jgi:trehalose utilization protein
MARPSTHLLVLSDDRYHPGTVVRAGMAHFAASCDIEWVDDPRQLERSDLTKFSVVVLAKSNHRTHTDHEPWTGRGIEDRLFQFALDGGGVVAVHSGIAGYQDVPSMRQLLGGCFVGHPPPCEVALLPESSSGLSGEYPKSFAVFDEHYQVQLDDPNASVFLRSQSPSGVQPAGWTRVHGRGRVCVLTPGHTPAVWRHPEYQRLLQNAVCWAAATMPSSPTTQHNPLRNLS